MGTEKDKSQSTSVETQNSASLLRRRAEEQLKAKAPEAGFSRTEDEKQRLVHELEVHRIELEMQNAELRQARDEVETALDVHRAL